MNLRRVTNKVASDFLDSYRQPRPTLWMENQEGDMWVPKLNGGDPPVPDGFVYQHSMFPTELRHNMLKIIQKDEVEACPHKEDHIKPTGGWVDGIEGRECMDCNGSQTRNTNEAWPEVWDAHGSRDMGAFCSGWSDELALGLVNKAGFDLQSAIIISARSCERCMNALAHEVGIEWGYPAYGEDWEKCGTSCDYCIPRENKIIWAKEAAMNEAHELVKMAKKVLADTQDDFMNEFADKVKRLSWVKDTHIEDYSGFEENGEFQEEGVVSFELDSRKGIPSERDFLRTVKDIQKLFKRYAGRDHVNKLKITGSFEGDDFQLREYNKESTRDGFEDGLSIVVEWDIEGEREMGPDDWAENPREL